MTYIAMVAERSGLELIRLVDRALRDLPSFLGDCSATSSVMSPQWPKLGVSCVAVFVSLEALRFRVSRNRGSDTKHDA